MIENNENAELNVNNILKHVSRKRGTVSSKTNFIIFWIIFFLIIVLIVIKGVLDISEIMTTLHGEFTEIQYTAEDVDSLTTTLENTLEAENAKLHTAYGLDLTLLPTYQVYSSEQGDFAMVMYNVKFKNNIYTVTGYTTSHYFNGLSTILDNRNSLIKDGKYSWDNSYIPKENEIVPTITPTQTPAYTEGGIPITSDINDTDEVIERGSEEEE